MTFKHITINRIPVNMEKAINDHEYEREVAREQRIAHSALYLLGALQQLNAAVLMFTDAANNPADWPEVTAARDAIAKATGEA
jgi:hypothetical protein